MSASRSGWAVSPGVMAIPLTRGLHALVEEADYPALTLHNWCAMPVRSGIDRFYAGRSAGGRMLYMQKALLSPTGAMVVDHINGNSLDNRRANLRLGSVSQNAANAAYLIGQSGYRGVRYRRGCAKAYHAVVTLKKQPISAGVFDTAEEAARAYDELARQIHGGFARLNFPRPGEIAALREAQS